MRENNQSRSQPGVSSSAGSELAPMSGWLLKRGGVRGEFQRQKWKRRYFTLVSGVLSYYEGVASEQPNWVLDLAETPSVEFSLTKALVGGRAAVVIQHSTQEDGQDIMAIATDESDQKDGGAAGKSWPTLDDWSDAVLNHYRYPTLR